MSVVDFAEEPGLHALLAEFIMPDTALSDAFWTGAGVNGLLSLAGNWSTASGFSAPSGGCAITFSSSAPSAQRTVINDSGGTVREMLFTAPGYAVQQAPQAPPLYLHTLRVNHAGGGETTIGADLEFHDAGPSGPGIRNDSAQPLMCTGSIASRSTDFVVHQSVSAPDAVIRFTGGLSGRALIKTGAGRMECSGGGGTTRTHVREGELRLTGSYGTGSPGGLQVGGAGSDALLTTTGPEQVHESIELTVAAGGSFLPGGVETLGQLILNGGTVNSGAHRLRAAVVGVPSASTWAVPELEMPQALSAIFVSAPDFSLRQTSLTAAGDLSKDWAGRLTIGSHAVPRFLVNEGELRAEGTSASGRVETKPGTVISGGGRVDVLDMTAGGTCQPGGLAGSVLRAASLAADASAEFAPALAGASATSLTVSGSVTLEKMRLTPSATGLITGQSYTILRKTSAGVISDRFTGTAGGVLEEGALLALAGRRVRLSYQGGDGNDITLTVLNDAPALRVTSFTPEPVPAAPGSRRIRLHATGGPDAAGLILRLQTSTTLNGWTTLASATASSAGSVSFDYTDPDAAGPKKFYRVAIINP